MTLGGTRVRHAEPTDARPWITFEGHSDKILNLTWLLQKLRQRRGADLPVYGTHLSAHLP